MILKKTTAYFLLLLGSALFLTACGANTVDTNEVGFKLIGSYPDIKWVKGEMLLSKDDKHLFVVNGETPNQIDILDISNLTTPKLLTQITASSKEDKILNFKVDSNDEYLYVTLLSGELQIYNIKNIQNIKLLNNYIINSPHSLALTHNDSYLYITGCIKEKYCDDRINIFDISNPKKIKFLSKFNQESAFMLRISPDNKKLIYVDSSKYEIKLLNIEEPLKPRLLDTYSKFFNNRTHLPYSVNPFPILFSNDSNELYLPGGEAGVLVFDLSKNKLDKIDRITPDSIIHTWTSSNDASINSIIVTNNNLAIVAGSWTDYDQQIQKTKVIKGVAGNITNALMILGSNIALSNNGKFFTYKSIKNELKIGEIINE